VDRFGARDDHRGNTIRGRDRQRAFADSGL